MNETFGMGGFEVRVPGLTLGRIRGRGSAASVYSARRDLDGWACAVKILDAPSEGSGPIEEADRLAARAAVRREIDVLTRVRVPGLVRLHEVLPADDGRLALVLDLVDGGVLRDVIDSRGHLVAREALGVLRVLFFALAALHAQGITHGDLSPSNVLISRDGRAVVGDLGGARLVGERPAQVRGTRGFTAPEVLAGGDPSPAADVYAAGAIGWVMVTGQVPPSGLVRPPAAVAVPGLPPALAEVLDAVLRGEPSARPTAAQALAALDAAGHEEPLSLPDGPDAGGRLTHRIRWSVEEMAGTTVPSYLPVAHGEPVAPVGRHRGRSPSAAAERLSRLARPLCGAAGRAVVAVIVGVLLGLGAWRGVDAWRNGTLAEVVDRLAAAGRGGADGHAGAAPSTDGHVGEAGAAPSAADLPSAAPSATPSAPSATRSAVAPEARSAAAAATPSVAPSTAPSPLAPAESVPSAAGLGSSPDPGVALRELLAARAASYAAADSTLAARVYAARTPLASTARADIDRLVSAGVRYDGLRYDVRSVSVLTRTPDQAVLRAVVDTGAYVVRSASAPTGTDAAGGDVAARPAIQGEPVTIVLRLEGGRWWLADIQATPEQGMGGP